MRNLFVRSVFAALSAILFLTTGLQAEEGKPFVVLVGIDQYQDPAITPRACAEADAKALYDLLADKSRFDCPADQIKLLLGTKDERRSSELATRENITKAVNWAFESAQADDLVLICWLGQGGPTGDRTSYFAADTSFADLANTAIGAAEIEDALKNSKCQRFCVVLDVNFKGYKLGDQELSEIGLDKRFAEYSPDDADSDEDKSIVVLAANRGLEPSIDNEKQGLFTAVLLDGLNGGADSEGGEPDGVVTVDELSQFVFKELPQRAYRIKQDSDQSPLVTMGRAAHFALTKNPEIVAKVNERLQKIDALVDAGSLSEEVGKEAREYLSRMPRLHSQRELRKK